LFEFLRTLPYQAREFLSDEGLFALLLGGAVLAIPPFLAARAYGWWGVILAVLAPVAIAILLMPLTEILRTFSPHENLHAYGMATWMYWTGLAFYLPFAIAAAGLGLWRRRRLKGRSAADAP
jgi:ABC-type Fe3+-siderophore transport system permease subunit